MAETFSPTAIVTMALLDFSSQGNKSDSSLLKTAPQIKSLPPSVKAAECLPAAICLNFKPPVSPCTKSKLSDEQAWPSPKFPLLLLPTAKI